MKIAIVHELLTMKGGAECVVKHLANHFPEAPIYTLLYDKQTMGDWFDPARIHPSTLQPNFPLSTFHFPFHHHFYLNRFPAAVEAWDFSEYDVVIGSSSAFVHGIITNGAPKHLCIVHSPARYLWDRYNDVLARPTSNSLKKIQRALFRRAAHRLRIWDSEAADRPDTLIAVSKEVQRRIRLYWDRDSTVIHPPIEDHWFEGDLTPIDRRSGFVIVSTLAPYKRIDLAIDACNALKLPLTIIGTGRDERRLKKLAGPTVAFRGRLDGRALRDAVDTARALIVPGEEDFGLAPIEALACGTPVIAYGKGGLTETVDATTGIFFDEPTAASLHDAVHRFDKMNIDPAHCRTHAEPYRLATFLKAIDEELKSLLKGA